jgi:23S rRNA pseudouridine1911/1915/1917 synthase
MIEPNARVSVRVVFEDEHLMVVEKPARVVTLPGLGHEHDTLLNGLFATHGAKLAQLGADRSYGLMHRLDRDTSGLVLVALRVSAYEHLYEQFKGRTIAKFYWAIVHKAPREARGVIRLAIEESTERVNKYSTRKRAKISRDGKASVTAYRVLESNALATMIEARPITGRLHQVRVHLDAIGCGILGDRWYGPRSTSEASPRLALHAHRLKMQHPATGEVLDVRSGWPGDLKRTLSRVGLSRPDLVAPSEQGEHEAGSDAVGEDDAALGES